MTKVEELRGYLWNKVFGADYAKMDELIDALIAAVREEGLDALAKANADGFAEGVEYTTSELATPDPLPVVYGDALPIKET